MQRPRRSGDLERHRPRLAARRAASSPAAGEPMNLDAQEYDVAVLGGGNAGLCAALTACQAGARVVVLETAPRAFRGGNSRHTRNLRCMHDVSTDLLTGTYSEEEYLT